MLRTPPLTISAATQAVLDSQQNDINTQVSYEAAVNRAAALWNSKESTNTKKIAFAEVKSQLQQMAPAKHYCCYCEHNEHGDIEHIYPKGLYPNKTFVWENYIWVCKECNTGHKLDKFRIFDPSGSNNHIDITPIHQNRVFLKPANEDAVLINPRVDNPMDFLYLDLTIGIFIAHPNASARAQTMANYTLELLELNDREAILDGRKTACKEFLSAFNRYVQAKNATNFQELEVCMTEISPVTWTQPFGIEKNNTCLAIKQDILNRIHPTVWKEFQRQAAHHSKLTTLFQQAPEALTW